LNILLTSAGRRNSLVQAFQEAVRPYGGKVLAADLDPLAPACAVADGAFCLPRVTESAFAPALSRLVRDQGVEMVIPTIDTELEPFSGLEPAFRAEGVRLLVSNPGFVAICRDKWQTFLAFQEAGTAVPDSWLPGCDPAQLPERVFLKPRRGSASLNVYACQREDLPGLLPLVQDPIIQECLEGAEITVDALLDFQGRPIHFVPRERIRTLAGESIQGVTLDLPEVDAWIVPVLELCGRFGALGPVTLQAFLTERGPVLTEINPRFGGGFPLALAAGGDYPAWLLALHRGEFLPARLGQYRRGLYMTRYLTEMFMETLPWAPPTGPRRMVSQS